MSRLSDLLSGVKPPTASTVSTPTSAPHPATPVPGNLSFFADDAPVASVSRSPAAAPAATHSAAPVLPALQPAAVNPLNAMLKAQAAGVFTTAPAPSAPPAALAPTPIVPAANVMDTILDTQISLTNDVAEWPSIAYTDIDTSTPDGQLKHMLTTVQQLLNTAQCGDALSRCMTFLSENPALADTLLPDEIGLLVQALESSFGSVLAKKSENKQKRTSVTARATEVANDLAELGF